MSKVFSNDRKIPDKEIVKIFQDSLYTVYTDIYSLKKSIKRHGNNLLSKPYLEMINKNSKDFYSEYLKHGPFRFDYGFAVVLIKKRKCSIINNLTLLQETSILLKEFIVPVKHEREMNRQFFVNGHYLFGEKFLIF